MKKVFTAVTALFICGSIFAQKTIADVAKFASESINLGTIKQGVPTTATFVVTNIGTEPLIIEQASPTCGCTIGDYTKSPIPPGKTGTITATYNAAAVSHFEKHMTVKFAGIDAIQTITISGDVVAATEAIQQPAAPQAVEKPQPVVDAPKVAPANTTKKTTKNYKSTKAKKTVATVTKS
jgi:Protein of unknown function (DUF1573)